MNVTLERDALLEALGRVKLAGIRTSRPILYNVLIRAEADGLRLTATDLDVEATAAVECDPEALGETTVPTDRFGEALRSLPSGADVKLSLGESGNRLTMVSGRARFQFPTLPASDFPVLEDREWAASFELPASDLDRLFDLGGWAYSTDQAARWLGGCYLHAREGLLAAASTNRTVLGYSSVPLPEGAAQAPGVVISSATVALVQRALSGGDVTVSATDALIRFAGDGWQITSKLLDGSFPDYWRVIPKDPPHRLQVDTASLSAALRRAMVAAEGRDRFITMKLEPERVGLSSRGFASGEASDELEAEWTGEPMSIGFNGSLLIDAVAKAGGEVATLAITDPTSPVTVTGAHADALAVIMPSRI